ncbi:glycosyltransferase family 4 protein [Streptomyces tubercidicus]|uniref:GDP-mannose-dependent alpha-mannosyltransferase n=1 Tax=Streptomyces tubercidicus TaxID=47759 RepID=A0A640V1Y0_9ACTN|nr:glycosyltransferase family 1 protein [Streptomyces tubercidicus]WAU15542.1 glycosyltransferase family 1 protein [Streptomyces tubercidicus]GFE41410.1 GDP-mannose-dependent alpha-mannosyltransferase [Streptomyces tubercidicus]
MRVVLVTESFPPDVNGVSHCALQTARHLVRRGHDPLVIAPLGGASAAAGTDESPCPVVRVPSMPLPGYPQVRIALPGRRLSSALDGHRPDLVHLASPFVLGARGMAAAARRQVPAIAVYQTDLGRYARTYLGGGAATAWRRIRAVHAAADRTLAPSSAALLDLTEHGVPRVHLWPRGVDSERFHPGRRDAVLRSSLTAGRELLVGYVGRLAPEKDVGLLAETSQLPGVRTVVIGDGPSAAGLRTTLPDVRFLGRRTGDELARLYASLDVFVHTGPYETFCQTVQEAMASGVPVVAPRAGGPMDLVDHGRTGLLVTPGDGGAFRDAVRLLADSAELRARFGSAARRAVADRSWEAVGDQLLGHYEAVLSDRTAVAA